MEFQCIGNAEQAKSIYPVMAEMRTHLSENRFLELWQKARQEGYQLVGLYSAEACLGLMGYRILTDFVHGRHLYIDDLVKRIKDVGSKIEEVIIATNPTMEGEATAMYLNKKLKVNNEKLKVSRLGMGIPTGADLEYADETTLTQALEGRRSL